MDSGAAVLPSRIDETMRLYEAQATLFAERISRLALQRLDIPVAQGSTAVVNVWRNHGFEPLEPLLAPYFSYRKLSIDFHISGYDDSFAFADREDAAADILWMDSARLLASLSFPEWLSWLEGRIKVLRAASVAPIMLATWVPEAGQREAVQALVAKFPAVYFADLGAVCSEADVSLLDARSSAMAGTPLSSAAQAVIARVMACHWLPGVLVPPIKAIALDLDHTLHSGVLGEDGIDGVVLTPEHVELQKYVKSLQERGIFIALVSRNERADVEALFAKRSDYPLKWDDFSAIEVSWGDKGDAIARIAKSLRIAVDAVVFVDDNPGELASVAMRLNNVHTIYAHADAAMTRRALHYYPGLWRWAVSADDAKRIQDLKAMAEREALAESAVDPAEYFRSLQVSLGYRHNPQSQLNRLADLCVKTNQFNLAVRRFNQAELQDRMAGTDACVSSVQLSDRLSDSGVIAVIVAERTDQKLIVEELCISCRAMGRKLEDTIVIHAIREMPIFSGCTEVLFRVQEAPRNQPATTWLADFMGISLPLQPGLHAVSAEKIISFSAIEGVKIIREQE